MLCKLAFFLISTAMLSGDWLWGGGAPSWFEETCGVNRLLAMFCAATPAEFFGLLLILRWLRLFYIWLLPLAVLNCNVPDE